MAGNVLQNNTDIKVFVLFFKCPQCYLLLFCCLLKWRRAKPGRKQVRALILGRRFNKFLFIMSLVTECQIFRMRPPQVFEKERSTIYYLFPQRPRDYRKRKATQKTKMNRTGRRSHQPYMYLIYIIIFIIHYKQLLKYNVSNDLPRRNKGD